MNMSVQTQDTVEYARTDAGHAVRYLAAMRQILNDRNSERVPDWQFVLTANNTEPEDLVFPAAIACPFPPARVTGRRTTFVDATDYMSYRFTRELEITQEWGPVVASAPTLGVREVVSTGPVNDFRLSTTSPLAEAVREANRRNRPGGR